MFLPQCSTLTIPADYLQRVKATHEDGGGALDPEYASESIGWGYDWSEAVTRTQLLRTHTTAVSSRTLYKLAELAKDCGLRLLDAMHCLHHLAHFSWHLRLGTAARRLGPAHAVAAKTAALVQNSAGDVLVMALARR